MCGRTACCRCSTDYQKATAYFNEEAGQYEQSDWVVRPNCSLQFRPSKNITPTEATPVLLSGKHCGTSDVQVLQPMVWSLIPPWHKGGYNKHGLSTNNARLEGLASSKLYSQPLKNGQRCVVIADGFYEWKKCSNSKQPYFVYAHQKDDVHVEDGKCWDGATFDKYKGWNGPNVLKMAGLFNVWTSPLGEVFPSYSVITMPSNMHFSNIHERMPATLETDEAVREWVDHDGWPADEALNALKPSETLQWHPVTSRVGNSRYKDEDCNKPISLNVNKRPNENNSLVSWLKTGSIHTTKKRKSE